MGTRGPGAKPIRRDPLPEVEASGPKPWEAPGLTRAGKVIAFIQSLTITQGRKEHRGKPFTLRPWQRDIIEAIYRTDERGEPLVREALITMGRKNGKTELAAAIALCHLAGPMSEERGEVYSAAADKYQAARIFRSIVAFLRKDPELSERINVKAHEKEMEVGGGEGVGSVYKVLSSDATKAHSLNPSLAICDELAQWRGRDMYDNIRTGFGARDSQLLLIISTKSADVHSVMSEVTQRGRDALAGVRPNPRFAAVIYEVPMSKDLAEHASQMWDEESWKLANPALGDFLSIDDMREEAETARQIPARESAFRNLKLNQEVDADERFIAGPEWQACLAEFDPEMLRGRPCYGGLDLSSTTDLSSLVLFFPEGGEIVPHFWVPGDRLDIREDHDRVPYRTWRDQGYIEATNGRAIDRRSIALRLAEISMLYDVRGIAYDRHRTEDLFKILDDEGIDLPLVAWGQGYAAMAPAIEAFEAAVLGRTLRHNGNQVMTWNVSNGVVTMDPAGNRKLDKDKAREKIDGLVAMVMAVGLHARTLREPDTRVFRGDDVDAIFQAA